MCVCVCGVGGGVRGHDRVCMCTCVWVDRETGHLLYIVEVHANCLYRI